MLATLRKYPHPSNPKSWMTEDRSEPSFTKRVETLLPYYFSPSEDIRNETIIREYFTKLMAGINNDEAWQNLMGIRFSQRPKFKYFPHPTFGWQSIWAKYYVYLVLCQGFISTLIPYLYYRA